MDKTSKNVDRRRKIPVEIQKAAQKVVELARAEKTNSCFLRSKDALERVFFLKNLGERSEVKISSGAEISRETLRSNIRKGLEDIEANGEPKTAAGLFTRYYERFGTNPRFEALEKIKEKALADDADPRLTMQYLKLICPNDFAYDPNGPGKQPITNNTLIINQNHVSRILQLPPDKIDEFIQQEAAALGINVQQIEQQAARVQDAEYTE